MALIVGKEVTIEVKVPNILLPEVVSNPPKTVVFKGKLDRRASYDDNDTVRVIIPNSPVRTRVIAMKNIIAVNGEKFVFSPSQKPTEPKVVEVKGSKGNTYKLTVSADGHITCNCPSFGFRRKCHHITDYLKEQA